MAIKSHKKSFFLFSFILLILTFSLIQIPFKQNFYNKVLEKENLSNKQILPNSSGENEMILPDKVYTFYAPEHNLTFSNVSLEKYYDHYIFIEIVTPHNCSIKIRVIDPQGKRFDIFEETLNSEDDFEKDYNIPFGTALSGNHTIHFIVNSTDNLNLHIKMEKTAKCLYDKLDNEHIESLVFYAVNRAENETRFSHNIEMKTDVMYQFYIGRVSSIAITLSPLVQINFQLIDPNGTIFKIYNKEELPSVKGVETFSFGTAKNGTYLFNMTVFCEVPFINLGYFIAEDYQISEVIERNTTDPVDDANSTNGGDDSEGGNTPSNNTDPEPDPGDNRDNSTMPFMGASIPKEYMVGGIIFFCTIITVGVGAIIIHKKKNIGRLKG